MATIGEVKVTLSVEQRRWFGPALEALTFACALVSMVSMHAANWLSDKGCAFLARHGMIYSVK